MRNRDSAKLLPFGSGCFYLSRNIELYLNGFLTNTWPHLPLVAIFYSIEGNGISRGSSR